MVACLSLSRAAVHSPISLPGLKVVRGERAVDEADGIRRRVERQDEQPLIARLVDGVEHRRPVVGNQDRLVAARDGLLDGLDLALGVGLVAPRLDRQIDLPALRAGLGAVDHRSPERVARILRDHGDPDRPGSIAAAGAVA